MPRPAKEERNDMIRKLYKKGKGFSEIGRLFNLHRSRVYQIINEKHH